MPLSPGYLAAKPGPSGGPPAVGVSASCADATAEATRKDANSSATALARTVITVIPFVGSFASGGFQAQGGLNGPDFLQDLLAQNVPGTDPEVGLGLGGRFGPQYQC